jgi:hypothetical protein
MRLVKKPLEHGYYLISSHQLMSGKRRTNEKFFNPVQHMIEYTLGTYSSSNEFECLRKRC